MGPYYGWEGELWMIVGLNHRESASHVFHHLNSHCSKIFCHLVGTWNMKFIFHFIWDVIRNPLTNSIIFQDGYFNGHFRNLNMPYMVQYLHFRILDFPLIIAPPTSHSLTEFLVNDSTRGDPLTRWDDPKMLPSTFCYLTYLNMFKKTWSDVSLQQSFVFLHQSAEVFKL